MAATPVTQSTRLGYPRTHINFEGSSPWGIHRTAQTLQSALRGPTSALPWPGRLVRPCLGRPVSRQGLAFPTVATRPTIRCNYGSNLLVFLRDREAPYPARYLE